MKRFLQIWNSWTGTLIFVLIFIFFVAQAFVIPSGSMKNTLLVGDFLFVKKFSYGIPQPTIPFLEIPVLPDFNGDGHIVVGDGPKHGDVVVFRNPNDLKQYYVKRMFAKDGDEVIFAPKAMFLRLSGGDEATKKFASENGGKLVSLNGEIWILEPYEFPGINYEGRENRDNLNAKSDVDGFSVGIWYYTQGKFAMQPLHVREFGGDGRDNAFYFKVPKGEYFMVGDNREDSLDSRFWGSIPYKLVIGKPWFVYFSWDKNHKVRWERIGRFADTLQNEKRFVYKQD